MIAHDCTGPICALRLLVNPDASVPTWRSAAQVRVSLAAQRV